MTTAVVIQHKTTFQYVRSPGDWTPNASDAHDFQRVIAAAEYCRENDLKNVRIIQGHWDKADGRFNAASKTILEVPRVRAASPPG
jgi:hypothetical protein